MGRGARQDLYRRRGQPTGEQSKRLHDFDALRVKEMNEAGIDVQVLSHGAPSTQKLPAETAAALTRRVHDRLHKIVAGNPRFAAFAALPTAVPEDAADELERTVKLGFKGAMLHGLANGTFPRPQAVLADLRARRSARCADLSASVAAERRRHAHLLRRLRQGLPDGGAVGLGLYGRDRDTRHPPRALRRIRETPPKRAPALLH